MMDEEKVTIAPERTLKRVINERGSGLKSHLAISDAAGTSFKSSPDAP